MARPDLSEKKADDGERFIAGLEGRGVDVSAAFWMFNPNTLEWRLFIISKDLDDKGPRHLLRLSREMLSKSNGHASFGAYDVEFESPSNPGSVELAMRVHVGGISRIEFSGSTYNDGTYPDMILYRVLSDRILANGHHGKKFLRVDAPNGGGSVV